MENEIEISFYYSYNGTIAFFEVQHNVATAILSLIAIIGVTGNFFVLMILAQNHQTQKANILIGGLALADLLYLSLCVPIQIHLLRNNHIWYHGETLCRLNNCLPIALQTAAIYSLVALSANRFNTVVKLTPTSKGCLGGNVYLQVVAVWAASGLTSLAGIFGSSLIEKYEGVTICSFMHFEETNLDFINAFSHFIILFAIPLVIIFVYYSRLAWHLYRSIQTLPDDGYLARHNQIIARRRLAVVVLALVIVFVICWLPYHIAQLLTSLSRYSHTYVDPNVILGIMDVLEPLTYAKSALNPLVLFTMSSFFRQRLKTICRCRKPRKQPTYTCMNSKHAASQRTRYTAVSSPL
ncbi:Bombesin receptor subtype-3 [Holothuria leucospilota]|uniref:Bombesin receptor subtype-3 n=1 Tax=Holothuria leucospilota TaxID=206669 RepID=A0A9Q0YNC7_HOLLE|nr:Bombesin receptor subtype-3 [Holothuria leucospilota]